MQIFFQINGRRNRKNASFGDKIKKIMHLCLKNLHMCIFFRNFAHFNK